VHPRSSATFLSIAVLWADVSIDNLIAEHLWSFSCDFASTDMMILASPAALITSSSPLSNVLSYSIKGPFEASHGFLSFPISYLTRDKSQDEDERTSTEVEPRPECQISGLVSVRLAVPIGRERLGMIPPRNAGILHQRYLALERKRHR
jgi:hypothetical protein